MYILITVYIIDPRYCPLDKEIRDEMQRAKLVGYASSILEENLVY